MRRPTGKMRWILGLLVLLGGGALALYAYAGFLDRDPLVLLGVHDPRPRYVAVLLSGDMGLRMGMGPHIAQALNRAGVPVLGINSPTAFASHRSRAEVDALIADSLRSAMARTGAKQAILIGQSFGADMARVGLAHLPEALRNQVAGVVLVVPGETAYFRADPTGLSYRGTPDAGAAEAAALGWAPLVCIRGAAEKDSLCPLLAGGNVRKLVLPGGHLLDRNHALLSHTIVTALSGMLKQVRR